MKVGIITLFGDNYGNKLQNYALQELLKEIGCEVSTVIIRNGLNYPFQETVSEKIKKFTLRNIYQSLISRFNARFHRKNQSDGFIKSIRVSSYTDYSKIERSRADSFYCFSKNYLSVAEYTIDENKEHPAELKDFDYFVVGSDQVWNRTRAPFFLTFATKNKRIAFAPSFGISELPRYLKDDYSKWISEIPHLSVREESGINIIRDLTGRNAVLMPDPTLCVKKSVWDAIEKKPKYIETEPFIVTYFLGNETNKYRGYIENYARINGCRTINLYDLREPEYYSTDPSEFVWLIKNARAIFTDSFHATVFSILFHKPFVVFDRIESGGRSMGSRVETLLRITKLNDRKYNRLRYEDVDMVDYSNVDVIIEEQRNKAINFLREAMSVR